MKIAVLCNSDSTGGAAIATARLTSALSKHGADAQMIVLHKNTNNLRVEEAGSDFGKKFAFYAERLGIFLRNGFKKENLFKVSTASTGIKLAENPTIKEADAIILSWINQGMLSLDELKKLIKTGKPIIWQMHDMWCFTGICHHAFGCDYYTQECGKCKFLNSNRVGDLSHSVWKKKKDIYDNSHIQFVAVSNWLKNRAKESSLLRDLPVVTIPVPFPIEEYPVLSASNQRNKIIMVAARLDDNVKGLDIAIDALNILKDKFPAIAEHYEIIFVGDIRNKSMLDSLKFPYRHYGTVSDTKKLRQLYAQSAVVLSSSRYESLGMTLIEGQACGAVPVSFERGGQGDIISDGSTGYIAKYEDATDLAECIAKAINNPIPPETLHASVSRKFSEDTVAKAYISLINKQLVAR